jgi:hypothetical protein
MDEQKVLAAYRMAYDNAVEDGHTEDASRIAWDWVWGYIERKFAEIKGRHEAGHAEAVNKAHFG